MVKVLAIGNSFSENATLYLAEIAASDGCDIVIGKTSIGGCPIHKHWNIVEQVEALASCANPVEIKPYNFFHTGHENAPASLKDALLADKWDFVTMQQCSDLSWKSDSYFPAIEKLSAYVKKYAPNAEQLMHQTWAYRHDSNEFKNYGINQTEMHTLLTAAYKRAAAAIGDVRIIPCGDAVQNARAVYGFTYDSDYDFDNPPLNVLPKQTDPIVGSYSWQTGVTSDGKAHLNLDGRHCSRLGCLLIGLVWYRCLTGNSLDGVSYIPEGYTEEDLKICKKAANDAVEANGRW